MTSPFAPPANPAFAPLIPLRVNPFFRGLANTAAAHTAHALHEDNFPLGKVEEAVSKEAGEALA